MAKDFGTHERVERIIHSRSMSEMWGHHIENMQGFGFDRMMYASTLLSSIEGWGDPGDRLILTNYPAPVMEAFFADDLHQRTAKVVRPDQGAGAYSWGRAQANRKANAPLTNDELRFRALCEKWDIVAGYTIWFSDEDQPRKAVLGLCARKGLRQDIVDAIWQRDGREIQALCNILHLKAATLPAPAHRNLLTPRQREVLNLIAEGHSVQSVASTLNRSTATIEKHLRLARKALKAETTANAVRKAAELNQLFILPGSL